MGIWQLIFANGDVATIIGAVSAAFRIALALRTVFNAVRTWRNNRRVAKRPFDNKSGTAKLVEGGRHIEILPSRQMTMPPMWLRPRTIRYWRISTITFGNGPTKDLAEK